MALVLLSYPVISDSDLAWIQNVRAEHDRLYYNVAAPHFTIIFPISNLDQESFVTHVMEHVRETAAIQFVLRCAVVVKDVLSEYMHVFLVPDEGFSDIVKVHDRLYSGSAAPHLRLDIPYLPHIGIGNSLDPLICKRLVDELNASDFQIRGEIKTLDIVSYEEDTITPIKTLELG